MEHLLSLAAYHARRATHFESIGNAERAAANRVLADIYKRQAAEREA